MKKLLLVIAAALMCSGLFAQVAGNWVAYSDEEGNGGSSTAVATENNGVVNFSGTVTTQYQYGYAGIRTDDAEFIEALKSAKGIKLTVKGDGKKYSVRVETTDRPDYCFHQFTFPTNAKEKTFEIPFSKLTQEPWGKAAKFDPSKIKTVSIHTVGQPIAKYNLDIVKLEILK
ncbi:CIA30 family protein [Treponema sp.]|uniref:CIA30 family protein n=1 Tax=Treponema sp. TaxID=166 RepID=UPI00298E0F97|nr:CIA30 family protein [Treponema sp.]MCQ2241718.1 CIA30 family protein [Treponema sp.]